MGAGNALSDAMETGREATKGNFLPASFVRIRPSQAYAAPRRLWCSCQCLTKLLWLVESSTTHAGWSTRASHLKCRRVLLRLLKMRCPWRRSWIEPESCAVFLTQLPRVINVYAVRKFVIFASHGRFWMTPLIRRRGESSTRAYGIGRQRGSKSRLSEGQIVRSVCA